MLSALKSLFKKKNCKNCDSAYDRALYKERLRDAIDLFYNYLTVPPQWKEQLDYRFDFFHGGIDEDTGMGLILFCFRETIDSKMEIKQINDVIVSYITEACSKLAESILKVALLEAVNELCDMITDEKRPAVDRDKARIQDAIELVVNDLEKKYNLAIAKSQRKIRYALKEATKDEAKSQK